MNHHTETLGPPLGLKAARASCLQLLVLPCLLWSLLNPLLVRAQPGNPTPSALPRNDSFIVTLRRDADCGRLCREFQLQPGRHYRHALNGFVSQMNADGVVRLRRDPRVLAVERDGPVELCAQTNGAGIVRMGVDKFPMASINGVDERIDVDVAVLDTGIDATHPDLNVVQSVDFTGDGQNGADWNGHGTHVAGIIGALDNDFGVVGVAPGARIWNVQVLGPTNSDWAQVLAGMDYVAQHADEIEVLNASFTNTRNDAPWTAIHEAVLNIVNQGVVFVAATGNNQQDLRGSDRFFGSPTNSNGGDDKLPASLEEVMAVSAIDPMNDRFPSFSNLSQRPHAQSFVSSPGAAIDVAAPGVGIYSCDKAGGYTNRNGTSMACAHASGLVALYIAANGRAQSAAEVYAIRQKLIDTALPETEWRSYPLVAAQDANPERMARPSESWIPAPRFTQQHQTAQGLETSFTTVPGYRYVLQVIHSLSVSNQWTDLTATTAVGPITSLLDASTNSTRFYRLQRQPAP